MTVWRMRNTCRITEDTDTHSEYVTRIAFPLKEGLNECASVLCSTYTCLYSSYINKENRES